MTDFADRLKSWFHPIQVVDGQVLWGPNDDLMPWEPVVEQYNHYRLMGKWLKPSSILEVGVGFGYSTMSLLAGIAATADHEPEVWWVDNEVGWEGSVKYGRQTMIREFGITPVWYKDREYFPKFGKTFDLIHIDAGHRYEDVFADLDWTFKKWDLYPHVICHDTSDPPVSKAIDDFLSEPKVKKWDFRTVEMPQVRCGVRVIHRCKGRCPVEEGLNGQEAGAAAQVR